MNSLDPAWQVIESRKDARILQGFTCTTDLPKSPGGRTLPHTKKWEWEAQRHLRQTHQNLQSGDVVLIGRLSNTMVAATCVNFELEGDLLQVFVAAAGISVTERGKGGALADQMLAKIYVVGLAQASSHGCAHLILAGKVHRENCASQRMVERAGWEPQEAPGRDYQLWGRVLRA